MKANTTDGRGLKWLGLYSALYLFGLGMILLILYKYGRTLVWTGGSMDGLRQPYTVIGYLGRALRDLLAGRGWQMVSLSLGQGMDTLTALSYYGFTDPLSLLAVFFSVEKTETAYILIDLLRMYLAGACFGLYARKAGAKEHWAVAAAALVYVFCGYFLRQMGRHPYFLNGALYLPLLLLGVERILQDRRWLTFTLVTALMLVVNFYFAYMNTVAAIIYIVVRLIARIRERGVSESAKDGFLLLGAYLLGAALSAVVFLPVANLFFSSSRTGVESGYHGSMLYYEKSYYYKSLLQLFAPWGTAGHYSRLNYIPLSLFGVAALFFLRGPKGRQVRVALVICAVVLGVPLLGKVMNGWAYVSNRWCYILSMFVALACALGLPELEKEGKSCRVPVALIGYAVAAALAALCVLSHRVKMLVIPGIIAALSTLLLIYNAGKLSRRWLRILLLACAVVSCMMNPMAGYTTMGSGYIRQQARSGVYDRVVNETAAPLIEDDGFWRMSQGEDNGFHALLLDYRDTSFYWSLVDGGMSSYYQHLGLPRQVSSDFVETLGASAPMNEVAAVKYFERLEGQDCTVPYGYEQAQTLTLPGGGQAEIYENAFALSLGYAFDAAMSTAEYDALPMEDKLQAILRCAITDSAGNLPAAAFESGAVELEYDLAAEEGAELEPSAFSVQNGGRVRLDFDIPEDCEAYLMLEGVNARGIGGETTSFAVRSENGTNSASITGRSSNFYFPKHEYALCLGTGPLKSCEIEFKSAGRYSYESLRVVALPLSAYRADAGARRAEGMTDVALSNNRITGRIAVSGDRVLQIAVPYSKGWRVWVDGEEQPVFRCGGMYMGVDIGAGEHEIEMRYFTPGLKAGAAVSLAALIATVALAILTRRRGGEGGSRKRKGVA